jgi:hypothetical protein
MCRFTFSQKEPNFLPHAMITDANRSNDAAQQLNLFGMVLLISQNGKTQKNVKFELY